MQVCGVLARSFFDVDEVSVPSDASTIAARVHMAMAIESSIALQLPVRKATITFDNQEQSPITFDGRALSNETSVQTRSIDVRTNVSLLTIRSTVLEMGAGATTVTLTWERGGVGRAMSLQSPYLSLLPAVKRDDPFSAQQRCTALRLLPPSPKLLLSMSSMAKTMQFAPHKCTLTIENQSGANLTELLAKAFWSLDKSTSVGSAQVGVVKTDNKWTALATLPLSQTTLAPRERVQIELEYICVAMGECRLNIDVSYTVC